jgi:hypothetical protein
MAYSINLSNGTTLIPGGLQPSTINTTASSLVLVGQNYSGYGQFLNDNFIHLLENFANTSSPANPLRGQLWWDTQNNILKVYSGTSWKISTGATSLPFSSGGPTDLSTLGGDLWFDTTNQQLKVYSGSPGLGTAGWITVGPAASSSVGNTGAQPTSITDIATGNQVPVIALYVNNTIIAIISSTTFTTNASGFTAIIPGLNFASGIGLSINTQDVAATNNTIAQRDQFGGLSATGLSLTGTSPVITGAAAITMASTGVLSAGSGTFNTTLQADTITAATVLNGNLSAYTASITTSLIPSVNNGATIGNPSRYFGNVYSQNLTVTNGVITTANVGTVRVSTAMLPSANVVGSTGINIGSSSLWFGTIYGKNFVGTSVTANYADLAERFAADAEYEPGTVVELGGSAEVTAVKQDLSETVFGVISTNAAYLMNSAAGSDSTHPPVAVQGRVPVKVIGPVSKGDRLVSAGDGLARAGRRLELTAWNVIGRSLEDKTTDTVGLIEAVVRVNS